MITEIAAPAGAFIDNYTLGRGLGAFGTIAELKEALVFIDALEPTEVGPIPWALIRLADIIEGCVG
ncbi:hypothetical protein ASE00_02430 [Sphingomonas sp. Root710]|nr:hypothetical protein ASE00_02430 [Sphingomonas sp. Root710]